MSNNGQIPHEIEKALRESFPHFQDGRPITPDIIREIGREWEEMITGWVPFEGTIEFDVELFNMRRKFTLEWEDGETDAGGWYLTEDSQAHLESIIENALDEEAQRHQEMIDV